MLLLKIIKRKNNGRTGLRIFETDWKKEMRKKKKKKKKKEKDK